MTTTSDSARLGRRLRPLRIALLLEGIAPWVPVEKVFMTQLGFTPALVATMAAAYGAVVPLLEIPSGILADRWSRRGVLMLANGAAGISVLVAALSRGVGTYIVSALILGVYFALQSGTVDAIVYDTLLEETGSGDDFAKHYGRIQLLNSAALTGSAVAGGLIASLASPRLTYVLTLPPQLLALVALARFREPTLHRAHEVSGIRRHLAAAWRAVTGRRGVAPIAVAMMLAAASLQMVIEFGPLWLVALALPAFAFGPYTAGITSAFGIGGLVSARLPLDRPVVAGGVAALMVACGLTLVTAVSGWVVIGGQIVLAVLLVTIGIHLSKALHDLVPSTVRSGVSSGIGTMSWLTFLPCAVLFGAASSTGVHMAGWIITVPVAITGLIVLRISCASGVALVEPEVALA